MSETNRIWADEFAAIPDSVKVWNQNVIPWMKERGKEYQRAALDEGKRRGYEFDYEHKEFRAVWKMHATRGRNLIAVGWNDGVLRCAFAAKQGFRFYRYLGVEEVEFQKILNNPFPDRLFVTNIKNKGYKAEPEAA